MIEKKFKKYILENHLFEKKDKLLLALSGGCDSVALFHLLIKYNYHFSAVHCNFKLRGKDSDKDEQFVTDLCKRYDIQLFKTSFNTTEYAEQNKLSLEEAARNLRYDWFEEVRYRNNFAFILTAHHLNDKIETFFINLIKGTGIKGLRSILPKNDKVVRPLLFAERKEIKKFCQNNNIQYRTDKSNNDTNFLRNKLRHQVVPVFSEINPKFSESMNKNFQILSELENIYQEYIQENINNIVSYRNNLYYIDLEKLLQSSAPISLMFEIIRSFGFNSARNELIFKSLNTLQTGKIFYSDTHRILKTEKFLIIDKKKYSDNNTLYITEKLNNNDIPELSFSILKKIPEILKTDSDTVLIDFEKIRFPLIVRNYSEGDFFFPFGMKGKKLLSDFFTDKKINLFERERIKLLTTADNQIIWIIGLRSDERFKITKHTQKVLQIRKN